MTRSSDIAILAYPDVLQSAVFGLQDVLGHAGRSGEGRFDLHVLDSFAVSAADFAAVILPPSMGGGQLESAPELPAFLRDQHRRGAVVCSACTGLTFVAAAGLDAGRKVTTHWGLEQRLASAYPRLCLDTDQLLIEYTDLITAGGLMAWVDLALALIERFLGYAVAAETARHFIVDFRRRDQRRFRRFLPVLRHGDQAVLSAQHYLEERLAGEVTVADMAAAGGLPARSFLRRFKAATGLTPRAYLQELRIERARSLLIETQLSVAEICFEVGYSDPPSFVRLFTRISGLTPGAFREHFRRHDG